MLIELHTTTGVSFRGRKRAREGDKRVDGYLPPEERLHLSLLDRLGRVVIDERRESLDTCSFELRAVPLVVSDERERRLRGRKGDVQRGKQRGDGGVRERYGEVSGRKERSMEKIRTHGELIERWWR